MRAEFKSWLEPGLRAIRKLQAFRNLLLFTAPLLASVPLEAAIVPIVHIQTAGASVPGATAATVAIHATAAGDVLIVGAVSSNGAIKTVTDNQGTVYTAATTTTASGAGLAIYYAVVPANVTSVTLTYPYGSSNVVVSEYSGLAATAIVDKVSYYNNGYNSGQPYTSGVTSATAQDYELAWGFSTNIYSSTPTWTADTFWTPRSHVGSSFVQENLMRSLGPIAATGSTSETSHDYEIVSLLVTMKGVSPEPPPDTTPPTVSMIAPPSGSVLSQTVTLSANASDDVAVGSVQFYVDGAPVGPALTKPPYTYGWDSTTVADGTHAVTALATDTSGNTAMSDATSVRTDNTRPAISSFAASPYYIGSKSSTTLTWAATSADPMTFSISGIGTVTGNSLTVSPKTTTTYTLSVTNLAGTSTAQTTVYVNPGVNVILDSDIAVNVDDIGDHALLWALNKTGEANTVALITSSTNNWSAPSAYAIANYYGHPNVMIGAYQGTSPSDYSTTNSSYTPYLTANFGKPNDTKANYPDAVTVYRKALAAVENNSMVIVAGGFYEPLRGLLMSPADSISPLTGAQLVAQKVKMLVPAAGWYPASGSASFNFAATPDAASYVFANWPTPIFAVGTDVGGDVMTGPSVTADPTVDPIKFSYNLYCSNGQWCPNMQYAWTQAAILYAVRGSFSGEFSIEGSNGTMTVADSTQPVPGSDVWSQSPGGQVSYVRKIVYPATMAATLNALIQAAP